MENKIEKIKEIIQTAIDHQIRIVPDVLVVDKYAQQIVALDSRTPTYEQLQARDVENEKTIKQQAKIIEQLSPKEPTPTEQEMIEEIIKIIMSTPNARTFDPAHLKNAKKIVSTIIKPALEAARKHEREKTLREGRMSR